MFSTRFEYEGSSSGRQ